MVREVRSSPHRTIVELNTPAGSKPQLALQIYQDVGHAIAPGGTAEGGLPLYFYYRVLNMAAYTGSDKVGDRPDGVIFDSLHAGALVNRSLLTISRAFFVASTDGIGTHGLDYSVGDQARRQVKIDSMRPFNPFYAATNKAVSRLFLRGAGYDKTAENGVPTAMINCYRFVCDSEMAAILKFDKTGDVIDDGNMTFTDGYSGYFFPWSQNIQSHNLVYLNSVSLDWRNESYSIMINNLPIKNFKNASKHTNGGYSKPILGNVPAPFQNASNEREVTAVFQPNYKAVSELYNQAFTTNFFDVQIRRVNSERPATELLKSVVNFTIAPPNNYMPNINIAPHYE